MARGNQPCSRHQINGPQDRRNDPDHGCRHCMREAQRRYYDRKTAAYKLLRLVDELSV